MAPTIVARAARSWEAHRIHAATCRYRRAGLVCSTCTDLAERAVALAEQAGKARDIEGVAA